MNEDVNKLLGRSQIKKRNPIGDRYPEITHIRAEENKTESLCKASSPKAMRFAPPDKATCRSCLKRHAR